MPKFFLITGLPRSRTAWLSALFSTGNVICFHEPTAMFGGDFDLEKTKEYLESLDYEYVGISDSSIGLYYQFYLDNFLDAPMVIIKRNEDEVRASIMYFLKVDNGFADKMVEMILEGLNILIKKRNALVIDFEKLNETETVKQVWQYCLPMINFDEIRCNILQKMVINQHIQKTVQLWQ